MRFLHTLDARQVNEVLAQARSTVPEEDPFTGKHPSEIHYVAPPESKKKKHEQS